jgi:DNA (cytosine-5)-methyltransferase 1
VESLGESAVERVPAQKLSVIDCFCGAGGMSAGLIAAGLDVRAAFDSWDVAVRTYRRNLGDHAICAKAEDLTGATLLGGSKRGRSRADVVVGGPPCQGFSTQRRGGRDDKRNDLVLEFMRIVREIRPRLFVMENVSAIQGPRGAAYLERVSNVASEAGFKVTSAVLNAADFGVPQTRRRYFLVGQLLDTAADCAFRFPRATHAGHHRTVRDAIGGMPAPGSTRSRLANHEPDRISELNRERISHVPQGGGREDIPEALRLPCHRVSVAVAGHRGVYGRLAWDKPSGTITTKCNSFTRGRFAHPEEDRNISMREAARLQSFPDSFVFEGSKVDVAHQIGNAVPPLLAKHIGLAIISALCGDLASDKRTGRP